MSTRCTLALALLTGLAATSGCGGNDGRLVISGLVTVDGEPLDGAAINFQAISGTTGPSSGGSIQDGSFRVPAADGLLPGTYRVTIIAMKETGRTFNDPQKGPVPELVQTTFAEPPREITVVDGGDNSFEFDLSSR